jgi:hypothetical protein
VAAARCPGRRGANAIVNRAKLAARIAQPVGTTTSREGTMKRLMRIHRYLSCALAPAMLFFAASGAWQAFRLNDTQKDGSYTAPAVLQALSRVHKADHLKGAVANWFRGAELTIALLFVVTATLGIVMALRLSRPVWPAWLCLTAGLALPALLALLAFSS